MRTQFIFILVAITVASCSSVETQTNGDYDNFIYNSESQTIGGFQTHVVITPSDGTLQIEAIFFKGSAAPFISYGEVSTKAYNAEGSLLKITPFIADKWPLMEMKGHAYAVYFFDPNDDYGELPIGRIEVSYGGDTGIFDFGFKAEQTSGDNAITFPEN